MLVRRGFIHKVGGISGNGEDVFKTSEEDRGAHGAPVGVLATVASATKNVDRRDNKDTSTDNDNVVAPTGTFKTSEDDKEDNLVDTEDEKDSTETGSDDDNPLAPAGSLKTA